MLVAFVCLPFIVRGLGTESFGLLSILWLFVGYSAMLDAGIGQAAVKFVAEAVGSGKPEEAARALQAGMLLSGGIGILAGCGIFLLSFIDFSAFLNIPQSLVGVAQRGLQVMALAPPAVLIHGTLRSVPLAMNRFGVANAAILLNGVVQWGGAVVVLASGGGLLEIVLLTVAARYVVAALLFVISINILPAVRTVEPSRILQGVPKLLVFGGWLSVTQIVAPLFTFLERFFIGGLLSLSFVTFFSVPNDIIIRFLAIPMALVTTLVPFMSGAWNDPARRQEMSLLYQRSIKFIYLLVIPLTSLIIVLSEDLLTLWLGQEFSAQSTLVLSILSVGLIFNALAQFPVAALQALGRPQIPAKVVLIEVVVYSALCYYATSMFGIVGTAMMWALRVIVEAFVLLMFARNEMKAVTIAFEHSYVWKGIACLLPGTLGLWLLAGTAADPLELAGGSLAFMLLYSTGIWLFVMDESERRVVGGRVAARFGRPRQ